MDDEHARHLVLQVEIELLALPTGVEEKEDQPGERYPDQEQDLSAAEGPTLHRHQGNRREV